ncbi:glycosyltransferase [Motilimonas cestriensis]|uniref:Glycosyltransferase n=1 Tax=Motilimonas cestriensis TaxID=2742685 RepID=A0ABS8W8H1_9GAMM|nr:glycosyltransferase [Motilimonas cestriensis]MCE2594048.1 glycosyltransferase [Motilimonas cestriensis]
MNYNNLNVAIVITALDIGGAETQVYELVKKFKSQGLSVSVISLIKGGSIYSLLLEEKFNLHTLDMDSYCQTPMALFKLLRFCRENKIHILHGHMFHAYILCRLAKLVNRNLKVISSAHSIYEGGKIRELLYRMTSFLSNLNTNVSPKACDYFIKNKMSPIDKMLIVPNGICKTKFTRENKIKNNSTFHWVSIGRLSKEKDFSTLIKAFELVNNKVDFKLTIVGTGTEKEKLEKEIIERGLTEKIKIKASIDAVYFYNIADAYICSSLYEGFGITLVEALYMELPIVTTDHEGTNFILKGYNNKLIAKKNNPLDLASSIMYLMKKDENERKNEITDVRENSIKEFSIEKISSRWLKLYKELLQE